MFDIHAALLTQWMEEMQDLWISRQVDMASHMHGTHHNMTQSQAATQVAQAVVRHAASQNSSTPNKLYVSGYD